MAGENSTPGWVSALPVVGQALGMMFGKSDRRQLNQQRDLQNLQIEGQKEMGLYNNQLQMDMWNKTNAEAQVEHLKNAGLNPGLMYKGTGAGGQIGSGTNTGVSGGQAANSAQTTQANTGMGMMAAQMALLGAQKENIEADTANKKATTENTGMNTEGQSISNQIASETAGMTVQKAAEEVRKIRGEAESAFNKGEIDRETQVQQINQIKANQIGTVIENELKKANIGKTEEETNSIIQGIKQKWTQINQEQQKIAQGNTALEQNSEKIAIEKFGQEMKANYPGAWNVAGKYVNDFVDALNNAIGQKDYKKHKVEK